MAAVHQPLAARVEPPCVVRPHSDQAEGDRGALRHRHAPGIIAVQHPSAAVAEDARLGSRVVFHRVVAVEVVLREVQHRRRGEGERRRGLELVAGELDRVELGVTVRLAVGERIQHRQADVAGGDGAPPGASSHRRDERGDGGLAVGSGHADHRGSGREARDLAAEDLDVADHFDAACEGRAKHRLAQRNARTRNDRVHARHERFIEGSEGNPNLGVRLAHRPQSRRGESRVGRADAGAAARKPANRRKAGVAEAEDEDFSIFPVIAHLLSMPRS